MLLYRHSITYKAFEELIELLSVHLPLSTHTTTVHKLKNFFGTHISNFESETYRYCNECHGLLQDSEPQCRNSCSGIVSQFLHIPIAPQLKKRLEGIYHNLLDISI